MLTPDNAEYLRDLFAGHLQEEEIDKLIEEMSDRSLSRVLFVIEGMRLFDVDFVEMDLWEIILNTYNVLKGDNSGSQRSTGRSTPGSNKQRLHHSDCRGGRRHRHDRGSGWTCGGES